MKQKKADKQAKLVRAAYEEGYWDAVTRFAEDVGNPQKRVAMKTAWDLSGAKKELAWRTNEKPTR